MLKVIDKQAVLEIAMSYCPDDDGSCSKAGRDIREMLDEIEALPTIEAEPVRYGKWHPVRSVYDLTKWVCSLCGHYVPNGSNRNYCPNCGAKMEEGADK